MNGTYSSQATTFSAATEGVRGVGRGAPEPAASGWRLAALRGAGIRGVAPQDGRRAGPALAGRGAVRATRTSSELARSVKPWFELLLRAKLARAEVGRFCAATFVRPVCVRTRADCGRADDDIPWWGWSDCASRTHSRLCHRGLYVAPAYTRHAKCTQPFRNALIYVDRALTLHESCDA